MSDRDNPPTDVTGGSGDGAAPAGALATCPHCGKMTRADELKPLHSPDLLGCPECRERLEEAGHHLRPGKHATFDQLASRAPDRARAPNTPTRRGVR